MPWKTQWVNNDEFMRWQGISVYQTYREDEYDDPWKYWYSLDPQASDGDPGNFDVRDLAKALKIENKGIIEGEHAYIISRAIDEGIITKTGEIRLSNET